MRKSVLVLVLLLASCATPPPAQGPVEVAPGVSVFLPPPASLGRSIEAVQLVTARHGKDSFTFEAHLSVTPERVLLAGTDGFGQRVMEVRWTGQTLTVSKAAWIPETLRPENILADVTLIYWPDAVVRSQLSGAEIGFGGGRRIGRGGTTLIAIGFAGDPWNGTAHLANLAWDYEIDVQSSVVTP